MESLAFAGGLGNFQDVSEISDMFIVCVPDFGLSLMPGNTISTPANYSLLPMLTPSLGNLFKIVGKWRRGKAPRVPVWISGYFPAVSIPFRSAVRIEKDGQGRKIKCTFAL